MATVQEVKRLPTLKRKKRVAAYARVSSGKDTMLQSLSAQVSYYSQLIQKKPEWAYAGVYADEARTGTKDTRNEFMRMVSDARTGKIDLIITKSISRFARNTVTLLETARELKSLGIDIFFEKENLHTMSSEGEMMLTIIASMAQEESRQVSENMKWRIRQDFKAGIIWGGKDCYGYRIVKKTHIVVPEEADVVRLIFAWYINGMGFTAIAKRLTEQGIPPFRGKVWRHSVVMNILGNIHYTGNLLLQKTFVNNHIEKLVKVNRGELPMYFVENTHEPIIPMEIFQRVTEIRKQRQEAFVKCENNGENKGYAMAGMLYCGNCGVVYKHRKTRYNRFWICSTYNEYGKAACSSRQVPEAQLFEALNAEFGYTEFDEQDFKSKVKRMTVHDGNRITLHFWDGSEKDIHWKDKAVRSTWTPEMREIARQRAFAQHHKGGKQ